MMKSLKFKTLLLGFLFAANLFGQQNETCGDMEPICTQNGLQFQALNSPGNVIDDEPGNNYDCLGFSPSPSWYFLEIGVSGTIDMSLTAPQDIDFIIWGPFPDQATAQANCGNLGNGGAGAQVVDCSYSGTNMETPSIPNAIAGETYVMLITNYANAVQDLTLTQTGGTGETDCSIVTPDPCVADAGTFTYQVNGNFIQGNSAILCPGDDFAMISQLDYTLPNDTIPNPPGDGVWNAEMMYLIYTQEPTSLNPEVQNDPGYQGLNHAQVGDQFTGVNAAGSYLIDNFGCGKFWIVPTPGDDGITTGDINGSLHYDKNGNGCYDLDTAAAFKLTLTCPIDVTNTISCDGSLAGNGIEFTINGGLPEIDGGSYIITNNGDGVLSSNTASLGGTVNVTGLTDGQQASIIVTDAGGCSYTFDATFNAPSYSVSITAGSTCGTTQTNNGDITVTGSGTTGPYSIEYLQPATSSGASPLTLPSLFAGDGVTFLVEDGNQCVTQGDTTIGSEDHFILTDVVSLTGELCPGSCDGEVTISAVPVDAILNPDGAEIDSVLFNGNLLTGLALPSDTVVISTDTLCAGTHYFEFRDDFGCNVTVPITISTPDPMIVSIQSENSPTCFGEDDGSINVSVSGGAGGETYSWSHDGSLTIPTATELMAGTYTCYVTNVNGCQDSITITLTQPDSLWFELLIKDVICYGDSTGFATITNVYGAQGPVTVFWQTNNPNPVNADPVSNLFSGTHTVQIFDDMSCESELQFVVNDPPELILEELTALPSYCRANGIFPGSGTVSGSASGGTGTPTYVWYGPEDTMFTATVGNRVPGEYCLEATDENGCVVSDCITVDSLNPQAVFTVDPMEGTQPVTVTITDDSQDRVTNTWEFGSNLDTITKVNSVIVGYGLLEDPFDTTFTEDAEHQICLIVTNDYGCKDTMCNVVTVYPIPSLEVPNVFTPNSDTYNDEFSFPAEGIEELEATIFNRWGNKVFEFTSPTDKWDGRNMSTGKPCADGVYNFTYKAKAFNGEVFEGQGFVHLISK